MLSRDTTVPQTEALEDALRQLFVMGALDEDGALTPAGCKMVSRSPGCLALAMTQATVQGDSLRFVDSMQALVRLLSLGQALINAHASRRHVVMALGQQYLHADAAQPQGDLLRRPVLWVLHTYLSQQAQQLDASPWTSIAFTLRQASLPLDPALAAAALAAARLGCMPDLLTVAAMLSADSIFANGRCAGSLGTEQRLHGHAASQTHSGTGSRVPSLSCVVGVGWGVMCICQEAVSVRCTVSSALYLG